jgi:tRNA(Arg) A34 adenosine deaminase TadA
MPTADEAKMALMRSCIAEARENARKANGGPFAALVVRGGKVVAHGANGVTSLNDPTAHAEIQAIRGASSAIRTFNLAGCELYASCEPCPMCLGAIYWARLDRVYFAATRLDAAGAGFDDARFYDELSRPLAERELPLVQLSLPEASAPFEAWKENPNSVRY